MQVIHADIVYSEDREHLAVHPDSYIAVEKGVVKGIWPVLPEEYKNAPLTDYGDGVLIPAFFTVSIKSKPVKSAVSEPSSLSSAEFSFCLFQAA